MFEAAREVLRRCRELATCSDEPSRTTRTFLSPAMKGVHERIGAWMMRAGMTVRVDAAGNIRGVYAAPGTTTRPRLIVASHLDTVPDAGAFDGILGVVTGIALVEALGGRALPFAIEVIGFSDEEGVRFGAPFIGSRAFVGDADDTLLSLRDEGGTSVADAITAFGLDPAALPAARFEPPVLGYLEFHIEQGPVLDRLDLPIGIVDAIAGQARLELTFTGAANHAGTTPMSMRRDALAGAAEWVCAAEGEALATPGLVATIGRIQVEPGATNVVPGLCVVSLDIRHPEDATLVAARERMQREARAIGARRGLDVAIEQRAHRSSTPMDPGLSALLADAAARSGVPTHRLASGAGHDAMVVAPHMPAAMLFVRTPGGVSHHPDETVDERDVAAALAVAREALAELVRRHG